jgi:hypothetical protein
MDEMEFGPHDKMYFGKRGSKLASKAMKLSWKKGISLKQAWKIVKGKKSGGGGKGRKNKLASKAMKLSWKKGISLKQAWKSVKKNKRSRFGEYEDEDEDYEDPEYEMEFGARRKKNKLAAEAMKLSWKKGISLKQAWKIVKKKKRSRFGVLSDYDMNYTKSGVPRAPCDPATQYRNPDTGKCIKRGSKTDFELRARGIYPPGEEPPDIGLESIMIRRNSSTGSRGYDAPMLTPLMIPTRSSGQIPKAPGRNYEWYPGWQQWRKKCKPGYERNYETRRCRKSTGDDMPSMSRVPSMSRMPSLSRMPSMSRSLSGLSSSSRSSVYDDMMYTKTGELRKPCNPDTEYRNPVTKRCVKIGGATDMQMRRDTGGPSNLSGLTDLSSLSSGSAYDDMTYTKTGELRKPCNPDTEYRNPVTKRCVKIGGPTDMQKRLFSEPLSVSRSGSGLSALSSSSAASSSYEPPNIPGSREPLLGYMRFNNPFSFGKKSKRRTCFGSCESCRVK